MSSYHPFPGMRHYRLGNASFRPFLLFLPYLHHQNLLRRLGKPRWLGAKRSNLKFFFGAAVADAGGRVAATSTHRSSQISRARILVLGHCRPSSITPRSLIHRRSVSGRILRILAASLMDTLVLSRETRSLWWIRRTKDNTNSRCHPREQND